MTPKIKPKKITQAPPPISPVTPGAVTTTPDRGTMTNKDYRAGRGYGADAMKKKKV